MNGVKTKIYKAVVLDAASHHVLCVRNGQEAHLPTIHMAPFVRQAQAFHGEFNRSYGLETIQLSELPCTAGGVPFSVHQLLHETGRCLSDHLFLPLSEIADTALPSLPRSQVGEILQGRTQALGRFARMGWMEDLRERLGWKEIREVHQLNCGIDFCLLSMRRGAHKVWFKAVGEPNTREFPLTMALSQRFPQYLPTVQLAIPEWNAWIAEEAPGIPLSQTSDVAAWKAALTGLATMQRETAADTHGLLEAGALNCSRLRLVHLLDAFFLEAERAMRAQTSTRVPPLTLQQLHALRAWLETSLLDTIESGLPETVLHGDIGHGNVLVSRQGPIFLDWAETSIGCPFLSAEHLLADLETNSGLTARQKTSLRGHYAHSWADWVGEIKLQRIVRDAPALAAFAYAVKIWEYHQHSMHAEGTWPLMRALLRRAQSEVEQAKEVAA